MYHLIVNMRLQAILECFVDDVIRSQNKSKVWTTIALSKFELEKRSKAQNVGNWTGYQKFKFQFHIQISKFWQVRNLRLSFHLYVHFSQPKLSHWNDNQHTNTKAAKSYTWHHGKGLYILAEGRKIIISLPMSVTIYTFVPVIKGMGCVVHCVIIVMWSGLLTLVVIALILYPEQRLRCVNKHGF